jgi:hypothetical protein
MFILGSVRRRRRVKGYIYSGAVWGVISTAACVRIDSCENCVVSWA